MKTIKEIKFIKNSGDIEDYNEAKMKKFLKRLGMEKPERVLNDFCEEVNGIMRTSEVISTLEKVAARKISPAHPEYENYAGALYLAAALNKDWNGKYPGVECLETSNKIDQDMLDTFKPFFKEINDYMQPERDKLFTYKAATIFHSKYCHNISLSGKREMPQVTYMRLAMFLAYKPDFTADDLQEVFDFYDVYSTHRITMATPIVVNALTVRPQTSSCSLMEVDDSTESLLDINSKIATMSAWLAGTACNIQRIRAKGTKITNGVTSGPIPFIKVFESTVSAWNQGGTRPGALCVYFQWWHLDVMDLLSLKSNGGTDENRARRLKYALKINDFFIQAAVNDEMVALVNPHEAPELYGLYGSEFEEAYSKYLRDPKTKKVRAREIWVKLFKERTETGNIYLFHEENVNEVSMLNRYISSSNLCTEVVLPTVPSSNFKTEWEI